MTRRTKDMSTVITHVVLLLARDHDVQLLVLAVVILGVLGSALLDRPLTPALVMH